MSSKSILEGLYQQIESVDYSSMIKAASIQVKSLNDAFHATYSGAINVVEKSEDPNEYFSEEEIKVAFEEQISSYQKFSSRETTWSKKKKIFYNIVIFIMIRCVWPIFIQPYLQDNIGMPVMTKMECVIKSIPETASEIIDKLGEGKEGIILENSRYYYKVSYIDESGEEREGYIAKRNLKLIESEEEPQK